MRFSALVALAIVRRQRTAAGDATAAAAGVASAASAASVPERFGGLPACVESQVSSVATAPVACTLDELQSLHSIKLKERAHIHHALVQPAVVFAVRATLEESLATSDTRWDGTEESVEPDPDRARYACSLLGTIAEFAGGNRAITAECPLLGIHAVVEAVGLFGQLAGEPALDATFECLRALEHMASQCDPAFPFSPPCIRRQTAVTSGLLWRPRPAPGAAPPSALGAIALREAQEPDVQVQVCLTLGALLEDADVRRAQLGGAQLGDALRAAFCATREEMDESEALATRGGVSGAPWAGWRYARTTEAHNACARLLLAENGREPVRCKATKRRGPARAAVEILAQPVYDADMLALFWENSTAETSVIDALRQQPEPGYVPPSAIC